MPHVTSPSSDHAVGDAMPLRAAMPADEVGRRGALDVDVELGLARRSRQRLGERRRRWPARSPTAKAARTCAAARSAAAASRACTTASGRPPGPPPRRGRRRRRARRRGRCRPRAGGRRRARARRGRGRGRRSPGRARRSRGHRERVRRPRQVAGGSSSRSAGPPSAAHMCAKRSAAAPEASASPAAARAASSSGRGRRAAARRRERERDLDEPRLGRARSRSTSSASRTSTALPAVRPRTWSMSVSSASQGRPAPRATSVIARASSTLAARSGMNAPEPALMSITSASSPAASFLDRIEATISGIDSTVPVASRSAYRRRSAGARSARLADDRAAGRRRPPRAARARRARSVAGDRVELVERPAGVPEAAARDHRHQAAARGDDRREDQRDLVADAAGRVLVEHRAVESQRRTVPESRMPSVSVTRSASREVAEEDRHRERGDLAVGEAAVGDPLDEEARSPRRRACRRRACAGSAPAGSRQVRDQALDQRPERAPRPPWPRAASARGRAPRRPSPPRGW